MRKLVLATLALLTVSAAASTVTHAQLGLPTLTVPPSVRPVVTCVDPRELVRARRNRIRPLDVADGHALAFTQEPAILSPDYTGTITLRDFMVAGDVPTVQFRFADGAVETWQRERMDTFGGRAVSVFSPSWPGSALGRTLGGFRWGWDSPEVVWGDVIGGAVTGDKQILLRMGPNSIPDVTVTRLADDVQFASNVVNIVLPQFGEQIALGGDDQDERRAVAQKFYEHFEDTYDVIAMVPHRTVLPDYTGVHITVKNEVGGTGAEQRDDTALFGSAGRLRATEIYTSQFATNEVSNHETAHQWGSYIDWTAVNGLVRAGHQPAFHDPLWANDPALLGASLVGSRRAVNTGAWVIDRSPAPIRFPPATLYAMGLLPKEQFPDVTLFDDQGQFGNSGEPAPGTPVVGGVRGVTISNIVGVHGERTGPAVGEWHRATVVVSQTPLTQREMNYWNFFSQRLEDPNRSGVLSYDGYGSFDMATSYAADLKTGIRPKTAAAIVQALPVDYPAFGTTDIRGLVLDQPLPTLIAAGSTLRISGRVTGPGSENLAFITFEFVREDGTKAVTDSSGGTPAIASNGTFTANVPFPATLAGSRMLLIYATVERGASVFGDIKVQASSFTVN